MPQFCKSNTNNREVQQPVLENVNLLISRTATDTTMTIYDYQLAMFYLDTAALVLNIAGEMRRCPKGHPDLVEIDERFEEAEYKLSGLADEIHCSYRYPEHVPDPRDNHGNLI